MPEALVDGLRAIAGFDEAAFEAAHDEAPATTIRLHPRRGSGVTITGASVPWCPDGLALATRPVFTLDPLFHAGCYYVQEASSMFLWYLLTNLLPTDAPLRVLDLCAAPGGKSTLIAGLLRPEDLLISNDVIRSRATILEENAVRWGFANHWVTSNDPKDFQKLGGYFDVLLVDAPCSGSGLFRKDEAAMAGWSPQLVRLCAQRQQRILADAFPCLKEGGLVVYATCSFSTEENEGIVDWLAGDFAVADVPVALPPEWGIVQSESPIHEITGYRFFPGRTIGEGFYVAVVRKQEASARPAIAPSLRVPMVPRNLPIQRYLKTEGFTSVAVNEEWHAMQATHVADFLCMRQALYFRKAGVRLGKPASAGDWIPAHDLALSVDRQDGLAAVSLSAESALKYLKRAEFPLEIDLKGWHIACYEGYGLGWVKGIGRRINNYLPKNWRVRMDVPSDYFV